jgi:hypothetical protein
MNKYTLIFIFILIIIFLFNKKQHFTQSTKNTLVLYTFHKYDKNVQYFIDNGIFKDDQIDFIFIINNKDIKVNCPDYVKIINRENKGYDFGAWSEGLLTNNLYKNYNNFIFVNSSVIGPIIPNYYKHNWTNILLDGLTDTIKLYGCTINTCGLLCNDSTTNSHIQSYAFCTDKIGIEILIKSEIFSLTNQINIYENVVKEKEIRMSREIINNNYNIGCIFNYYNKIDFRQKIISKALNDITHSRNYYNEYLHPYEVLFIKEKYIENKDWIKQYIT